MKIIMFTQSGCAACRYLRPHLEAAAKQLDYDIETRNIDDGNTNWSRYDLSYTPTVFVLNDDDSVIAKLETTDPKRQAPSALAIKAELEQFI